MKRSVGLAVFLTVFLSVYGAFNYFAFDALAELFGYSERIKLVLTVLCTAWFVVASGLEGRFSSKASNGFYVAAAGWMGFVMVLNAVLFLTRLALRIFDVRPQRAGVFALIVALAFSVYAVLNALRFAVRKVSISSPHLRRRLRIVHLSDVHIGPVHGREYLARIVAETNRQRPDLVLITGDFIDGPSKLPDDLIVGLNDVRAPVYWSLGNHEWMVGLHHVERLARRTKARVLANETAAEKGVTLIGINDNEDPRHLNRMLPRFKKKGYTILLYHRPDGLAAAQKHGVHLMLSGHTHAGQIFPFMLLVKLRFQRMTGLHRLKDTYLSISSGTGTWGPPMRLGSRSELVVIDVHPSRASA